MVLVPAGPFVMGCEDGDIFAPDDAKPSREVTLSAFWIDIHPVTNERFARFVDAGGYRERAFWDERGWAWRERSGVSEPAGWRRDGFAGPRRPVAGVSWHEAMAYCRFAGKTLPTEAQWEKAARGAAPERRRFPWGEAFPRSDLANFGSRVGHPTDVDAHPLGASPFGCTDMAGNVNNWCRDRYWSGFYGFCAGHGLDRDPCLTDELAEKLGLAKIARSDRGGGFATDPLVWEVHAVTGRIHWDESARALWNGFRTVVEVT